MTRATVLLTTLLATLSMGAIAQQQTPGTGTGTGATTGSGVAPGEAGTGAESRSFEDFDANQDDYIDEREARDGGLDGDWNELDANRDNNVDRDEFENSNRGNQMNRYP